MELTKLELELLTNLSQELDRDEPDYSNVELDDVSNDTNRDRGVLASLIKKGIVEVWEQRIKDGDSLNGDFILITPFGWELV